MPVAVAIAIGMLGDGAIVLVENAVRLFGREAAAARDRRDIVRQAAQEVAALGRGGRRPGTFAQRTLLSRHARLSAAWRAEAPRRVGWATNLNLKMKLHQLYF